MPITSHELDNRFGYHRPGHEIIERAHKLIRDNCRQLASTIVEITPEGREQSVAITKLQEVMHWANSAIACNQEKMLGLPQT